MVKKHCKYVNGVCSECGRPKGWRVHRLHRINQGWADCPGRPRVIERYQQRSGSYKKENVIVKGDVL